MNYKQKYYKHHGLAQCDIIPCVMCEAPATNLHHVKYKSQGGTNDPQNLAPMCYYCHSSHHMQNKPTTKEIIRKCKSYSPIINDNDEV